MSNRSRLEFSINSLDEMAFTDLFQDLNALCNVGNKDLSIHKGSKDNTTLGDITGQLYPPLKYGEAYENIKSEAKVYILNLSTLIRLILASTLLFISSIDRVILFADPAS